MTASRIHRLTLTHFRNYRAASVTTRGDVIVLVGSRLKVTLASMFRRSI